jgi:molecular chaperone DnaK
MPGERPLYVGIDLGTTNSATAVFDGEACTLVRNRSGGMLTPSVVRIDAKGNVTTGERARRFLDADPSNTAGEFKRLMGTAQSLSFPASGTRRTPEELSAEILRSLRSDLGDANGVETLRAVVSVPALFELPQNRATAEAARLAGFDRVELIQEPVASALAAGWRADDGPGAWLVYDLGGGTFDASLLETRDGLLRVVGHDGDNFLGGRDFDGLILDWLLSELSREHCVPLRRADPVVFAALRRLRPAVEEAKIELSRTDRVPLALDDPVRIGEREIPVELELTRAVVDDLCAPLVERSLKVCRRLLQAHGLGPAGIEKIVLVGGPTMMPLVRSMVRDGLGTRFAEGLDPMTLVAQGAAFFAATVGLDARAGKPAEPARDGSVRVWLQHPAVASDLAPFVVGRFEADDTGRMPRHVRIVRKDGGWTSEEVAVDAERAFVASLQLRPRATNEFAIEGLDARGGVVPLAPDTFSVIHGVTIGDPPLSRSIGVALADDSVRTFFERGAPLPATRSFVQHTVASLTAGGDDVALKIPIVQGEFAAAHLCRPVGAIEIRGRELGSPLPAGSPVEITLAIDRGGRLVARAHVPPLAKTFEHVERLVLPDASPDELLASIEILRARLAELRGSAFRGANVETIRRLGDMEQALSEVSVDIEAARGGDPDAGQKARRALLDLDAALGDEEVALEWPKFVEETSLEIAWAARWVSSYGTPVESRMLDDAVVSIRDALAARGVEAVRRRLRVVRGLANAAYFRHPSAWEWQLDRAAGEVGRAHDRAAAERAVRGGRDALARKDVEGVRAAVVALWRLLPPDVEANTRPYDSGLR